MAVTNKGKFRIFDWVFRSASITPPTNFYIALVTSAVAPTVDTNSLSALTEIAAGDGYTAGGYQLTKNSTDFDSNVEDDSGDKADIQIKDVVWTATGGSIPISGNGARYAVLTNDGTLANREVLAYWDLTADRSVSVGQTLTLQDLQIRLSE